MGLKVWLPLNQDLKNKGISNLSTFSYNSFIQQPDGKIGKCYSGQGIYHIGEELIQNTWSLCAWVKSSGWSQYNDIILCKNTSASDNCQFYFSIINGASLNIGINGSSASASYGYIFATDTWYHVAATYDGTKYALYINGIQVKSGTITNALKTGMNNIGINCRSTNANGTSQTGGGSKKLNDVRIYDHCLSAAEVREISQGLILHYKLDDQYIEPTINLAVGVAGYEYQSKEVATYATTIQNKTTYGNKIFTYSAYIKNTSDHPLAVRFNPYNAEDTGYSSFNGNYIQPGQEGWSIVTANITDTSKWNGKVILYIQNGNSGTIPTNKTFYIKKVQVEEKDHATPFTPTSREAMNIQDSSGYGHNGTITGDLTFISESQRYSTATKWNCSDPTTNSSTGLCYIQTPLTLTTPLQMSIVWWAKPENGYNNGVSNAAFCTSNDASAPRDYNTTAFHHRDASFDIYPSDGSGVKRLSFTYTKNEWHHYAITYDGTIARSYKDGVQQTSVEIGTNKTLASFTQLYIGFSKAGEVWRKTKGSYSDFRIYCTSLLDTDIKLLYNTSMRLDNLGNCYTYELNENKINLMRRPENARAAGKGLNSEEGLSAYTQSNCQVTCNSDGYKIYRPANLTVANDGNTMYGGLKIRNSINSATHIYDAAIDNIFNLQKGHTYIWIFTVNGSTENAPAFLLANHMGWPSGGLVPAPSNVVNRGTGSNFNGTQECWYKFTINDDIVKTCTSSYSSFVQGNQYLSYMDFGFYFGYQSTGTGTNLYISNIRLYDITNIQQKLNKTGIANFTSFIEENYNSKILSDGEFYGQEFIEM